MSTPQPAPHSQVREQAVRRTPAWACGAKACVLSVLFALCASATLQSVPDRSWAAVVGAIAVAWGCALHRLRLPRHPLTIIALAACLRILFVGSPPWLSDDLYRYLWEGQVLLAGGNPFVTPPSVVEGLDDSLRALVNHPEIPSIYPPLALWWFQLLGLMGGTPLVAQLATASLDVALVATLLFSGRVRGAALYALHPLPVLESAASAHIDILALLLLTLALTVRRAHILLAVLAGSTKLLPFAVLPALLRGEPTRAWLAAAAVCMAAPIALAWPVLDGGSALFEAAETYARHWTFNPLAYVVLTPICGALTRPILVAVGLAATAAIWRQKLSPWATMACIGLAFLLVSPTVHPWYVLWVFLPAAVLEWRSITLASSFFPASYAVLWTIEPATGAWSAGPWLAVLTWVPALLIVTFAGRSAFDTRQCDQPVAQGKQP